jgi:hypothetical protein
MTTKIWLRIFGIMLLVIIPIFLTQFIQQRQALFLAATLSGAVPEKKTLERLRLHLVDYALLKPEIRAEIESDFTELALLHSGTRDIIYAKNEAVFQLERQL